MMTTAGFGSHGTVVFKGSLQGRAVAVKRLLRDFVTLASREVSVLQESDDHPNVIRYYYQESHANFLYIALELCPASLADVIERPDMFREIVVAFEPKRALRQVTAGLRHLHGLKIIHRDIKPQNILISHAKPGANANGVAGGHRMLISDFGLCKKLEVDQTSFYPTAHGAMAAGTVGWRAPEILRGDVSLDSANSSGSLGGVAGEESQSSRGSAYGSDVGTPTGRLTRLTKSVDVFALGCLYYYVLTNGGHPFGDRYERDVNILKGAKCLDGLERFGEEGSEAVDVITKMLSPEARERCVVVLSISSRETDVWCAPQTGHLDVSSPSVLLGPRQTTQFPPGGLRPVRNHVSRPSRSSARRTRTRCVRRGWQRLEREARQVVHRDLGQVPQVRRQERAGLDARTS